MESVLSQHSSPSSTTYKIRGTKVISPYPVNLTPAEIRLVFSLQRFFLPQHIFPDLYLPKVNFRTQFTSDLSNFTLGASNKNLPGSELIQIDCLAINEQGIFVFESKDYAGWIYGNAQNRYWTQTLNYGQEKHQFYSPIKQNQLHIDALTDFLGNQIPIYSIIVFSNEAEFKTNFNPPTNCQIVHSAALRSALSQTTPKPLTTIDIKQSIELLNAHRIYPTNSTRQAHINDIESSLKNASPHQGARN